MSAFHVQEGAALGYISARFLVYNVYVIKPGGVLQDKKPDGTREVAPRHLTRSCWAHPGWERHRCTRTGENYCALFRSSTSPTTTAT